MRTDMPRLTSDQVDEATADATGVPEGKPVRRKKSTSPTQRSLKELRDRGYLADVVERWIPMARRRKDLFGFIDILAVHQEREGDIVGVQACSAGDVSTRIDKIINHENVGAVRKGGIRILVHGWAKRKGRWQVREVDVS